MRTRDKGGITEQRNAAIRHLRRFEVKYRLEKRLPGLGDDFRKLR